MALEDLNPKGFPKIGAVRLEAQRASEGRTLQPLVLVVEEEEKGQRCLCQAGNSTIWPQNSPKCSPPSIPHPPSMIKSFWLVNLEQTFVFIGRAAERGKRWEQVEVAGGEGKNWKDTGRRRNKHQK